jgi:hypothetical protein
LIVEMAVAVAVAATGSKSQECFVYFPWRATHPATEPTPNKKPVQIVPLQKGKMHQKNKTRHTLN